MWHDYTHPYYTLIARSLQIECCILLVVWWLPLIILLQLDHKIKNMVDLNHIYGMCTKSI
jgi:hypothetical protein